MVKYVYDFCEGSKEMLDLLGRQRRQPGRNDQPGPSRPTRFHDNHRSLPDVPDHRVSPSRVLHHEISEHLARLEQRHGQEVGRPRRPLAGIGAERGQVLDAGDDGHRPRRRAQRQLRRRTGQAVR